MYKKRIFIQCAFSMDLASRFQIYRTKAINKPKNSLRTLGTYAHTHAHKYKQNRKKSKKNRAPFIHI